MMIMKKLQIPEIKEQIIEKPQMEKYLANPAATCVIVKAMSGFGKTAVFARIAAKYRETARWYTLDATDNDSGRFLTCLEYLWETVDGRRDSQIVADDLQSRLLALIQRTQDWQKRICLVLDNLQEVSSPDVFRSLLFLQRYTRERLSFVLLTNQGLPDGFLPLLLKERGVYLSETALRLTGKEVWQLWGDMAGLSCGELYRITEELCGWPLGVRCVLEYLRDTHLTDGAWLQAGQDAVWQSRGTDWNCILRESLLSVCLDEVLWNHRTVQQQIFLRQTAVLGEFSWELCRGVSVDGLTRQTYEEVVACRGILDSLPEDRRLFRYGRAFAVYLLGKTADQERDSLYRKAALWYQREKRFVRMAEMAVMGRQDYFLVMTLEQYGKELLQEQDKTALGIMASYLEQKAALLLPEAAGILAQYFYSRGDWERMEGYLNAADSCCGKENKYACYRSLYRALRRLGEDREKYGKRIRHALFFLREDHLELPFLREEEENTLKELEEEESGQEKLEAYTFGSFRVVALRDGRELAWRTRKGRELFAYLLDIEGKAVQRDRLLALLWPDGSPDHAVAMLHNMIYHIRKELSAYRLESALLYENRRYRIRLEEVRCDFYHIRRLAELVERGKGEELKRESSHFMKYWGSYLEDIDSPWAEEKRRYYDEIFQKGCWMLAEQFVDEGEYDTALILYKNISALDPYSERVIERMLLLYGRQKKWEEVTRCYHSFRELLTRDLGIAPGEDVVAAYHTFL